jgi:hypothetical protein
LKLEADSGYHLVIADGDRMMIVEIPLPSCIAPGPDLLRAGIGADAPMDVKLLTARLRVGP